MRPLLIRRLYWPRVKMISERPVCPHKRNGPNTGQRDAFSPMHIRCAELYLTEERNGARPGKRE